MSGAVHIPGYTEVARKNIRNVGLTANVILYPGAVLDVLTNLEAPFDLILIDANKVNSPHYLERAIRLSHSGSIIIDDNTVRGGSVIDSGSHDPNVIGLKKIIQMISGDERLDFTSVQTVR